ncbi:MAG TPA: inositol monophosphatase family protein [Planctomycetota bacterium]|nr:inositol monophosphatase family protein [Planctomycetota bacterium]
MSAGLDIEEALDLAVKVARHVGREIQLPRLKVGKPDFKGVRDLVTEADRLSERAIVSAIRGRYPEHAIFAEEEVREETKQAEHTWYVDPLDGTTNFVHGLPLFCSSIALYRGTEPLAAVCYNPCTDECFFGAKAFGAYLNSETIKLAVTGEGELVKALLVTGFAYDQERYPNLPAWNRMIPRSQGVRRLGSAALDLCYVAAGRFDGYWECGLNPFDIAAGALLVMEAGGRVTDYSGGPGWLHGRSVVATNGALHATLLEEVAAAGHPAGPGGV